MTPLSALDLLSDKTIEILGTSSETKMQFIGCIISVLANISAAGVILDSLPSNNGCSIAAIAKAVVSINLLKKRVNLQA